MTTKPKPKNERMLQSLLVEVCGVEAKAVIRAAVRWRKVIWGNPMTALAEMGLIRAVERYTRAKALAKGK